MAWKGILALVPAGMIGALALGLAAETMGECLLW